MSPVLDEQFVAVFLEEAADMLADWERFTVALQRGVDGSKLDALFRSAHNLKGSARSVGLEGFAQLVHEAEDTINLLRDNHGLFKSEFVVTLLLAQQVLVEWREVLLTNYETPEPPRVREVRNQLEHLKKAMEGGDMEKAFGVFNDAVKSASESENPTDDSSTREPLGRDRLDDRESSSQDASFGLTQEGSSGNEKEKQDKNKGSSSSQEMIRVPAQKIDVLMQIIGELSTQQATITHCLKNNKMNERICANSIHMAGKLTRELQLQTMALRLLDLSRLFVRLERVAMDVAIQQGKKLNVVVTGSEVELDKSVIERITDPLVHMIRNAVDHGIEANGQRPSHKPEAATVSIHATQSASGVQIELVDDGRGIDPDRILAKAREKGLLSGSQKLPIKKIYDLLFLPGFSTAEKITDISGRGVGLDVVKRMVDEIDGTIDIESEVGRGTRFTIVLPTNVSIIDSLVVSASGQYYVVPIQEVAEVIDLRNFSIESQTSRSKTIALRERAVTICPLESFIPDPKSQHQRGSRKVAEAAGKTEGARSPSPAMIIEIASRKVGFEFEQVIGQQPILIRKLAGYIAGIPGFSGSTVLATGEPAVILSPKVFARQYFNEREVQ